MGREINMDRIHELEKQIGEGAGDTMNLKRARNSLLNISIIVPPEILGTIFRWNVATDGSLPHFSGPPKGSYNFLRVCHHWFEVASHTPELWSYWGNTVKKWLRRYKRSGTTPVDLVLALNRYHMCRLKTPFDGPLRDAVRERAGSDAIRSLNLCSEKKALLTSVLSTLTPDNDESIRHNSIESIALQYVDVSNFFARHRFPKLWYLNLSTGVTISSWEVLGSHTTALTTLSLTIKDSMSHIPTTLELLSILTSNPRLQNLTLSECMIPRDNGDGSTIRVPLRHLKELSLSGKIHLVFQLLSRIDHPEKLDWMALTVFHCTVEDTLGILGPYVQAYVQRDGRFRDGLGILISFTEDSISIQTSAISNVAGSIQKDPFATFTAMLQGNLPPSAQDNLCINFVAHVPREHVMYFSGGMNMGAVRGIISTMPNIQELHLSDVTLADGFLRPDPDGPHANKKLLPSLRRLHLEYICLNDDDWSPLIAYLTHQTLDGQRISLALSGGCQHICKDTVEEIRGLVEEFVLDLILEDCCPFDYCLVSEEEE